MSYSRAKGGWEVRWRDAAGRQRSRRFRSEEAAAEFDASIHDEDRGDRRRVITRAAGVYPYETAGGTRWRYVTRRSDDSMTSKRGFSSAKAARDARRRLVEQQERGEIRHTRETFGAYWERWLAGRRAYLEPGTWEAYERDGRLRLLPVLGGVQLGRLGLEQLREAMDRWIEGMEAEELAPKTVNNTLGTLVVCLNAALEDGLIPSNPALRVRRLPLAHIEREYLRLHEIPIYLDSCSAVYRPLAEVLIGAGLRISEALTLRMGDLELEDTGGAIVVYRSSKKESVGSTKSDRFRAVEIGPGLAEVLRDHTARRGEMTGADSRHGLLFPMPVRVGKDDRGRWGGRGDGETMDRNTVSRSWHKQALEDAALRDMPLAHTL